MPGFLSQYLDASYVFGSSRPSAPTSSSFHTVLCPDSYKCVSRIFKRNNVTPSFPVDRKVDRGGENDPALVPFLTQGKLDGSKKLHADEQADDAVLISPSSDGTHVQNVRRGKQPIAYLWEDGCPFKGVQENWTGAPENCDVANVWMGAEKKGEQNSTGKRFVADAYSDCKPRCYGYSRLGYESRACTKETCKCIYDGSGVTDVLDVFIFYDNLEIMATSSKFSN